ncbi:AN1-type zinc finger domain-containing protein [Halorubrum sp. HHNYT27]|uniref:AN1-type zinc finger domain-containing protein n=1 Tax=Halorubrum sp. HHNYT27 TaxID=3402275 RepID=UPI003EBFE254
MTETPFRDRLNEDDPAYRKEHASHRCTQCNWRIFSHEKYQCSYCGDDYCPDHRLPEKHECVNFNAYDPLNQNSSDVPHTTPKRKKESLRENISRVSIQDLAERTRERREQIETKQDKIKQEQKEQFASPDVNLDGSLSEPQYEEDIQSIGSLEEDGSEDTGRLYITKVGLIIFLILLMTTAVYIFIL